jgi:ferredoxin-like protein FixX
VNINEKLAKNRYIPDAEPHIVPASHADCAALFLLVNACPAGLYHLNQDGSLRIDVGGCLECGTCRLLCDEQTLSRWRYPPAGFGIQLRFG